MVLSTLVAFMSKPREATEKTEVKVAEFIEVYKTKIFSINFSHFISCFPNSYRTTNFTNSMLPSSYSPV